MYRTVQICENISLDYGVHVHVLQFEHPKRMFVVLQFLIDEVITQFVFNYLVILQHLRRNAEILFKIQLTL